MPKFSVYIPDALWKRAQTELGELNMSQFVQQALNSQLTARSPASGLITRRPTPDGARIERIRARYSETADAAFADGYEVGMVLAERLSADELIQLHEWEFALVDYDLVANSEPWARTMPSVLGVVESVAEEHWGGGWRATLQPGSVVAHGAVAALRDVWTHLFEGEDEEPVDPQPTPPRESKASWEHLGVAGYLESSVTDRLNAAGYTVEDFWELGIAGPWTPELVVAVADAGGPTRVRDAVYAAVADAISPEGLAAMLEAGLEAIQAAASNGPFRSERDLLQHL